MQIYSLLKMGNYHQNFCEDFLVITHLDQNTHIIAVTDGCSMGVDSHFASVLFTKILKKVIQEKKYQYFFEKFLPTKPNILLKEILKDIFENLKNLKNILLLDTKELLSTLILAVFEEKKGVIMVIGDGVINLDNQIIQFEQDNKPDYLAYHLGEDFEGWFLKQKQIISFENIHNFSISTDGLDTFQKLNIENTKGINLAEYLLQNNDFQERSEMLDMKSKILEKEFSLKNTDDLAIIRVIF